MNNEGSQNRTQDSKNVFMLSCQGLNDLSTVGNWKGGKSYIDSENLVIQAVQKLGLLFKLQNDKGRHSCLKSIYELYATLCLRNIVLNFSQITVRNWTVGNYH